MKTLLLILIGFSSLSAFSQSNYTGVGFGLVEIIEQDSTGIHLYYAHDYKINDYSSFLNIEVQPLQEGKIEEIIIIRDL